MPKLSDTNDGGHPRRVEEKKATRFRPAKVLAEIETDKATMEWESPEDGTLTEIYVQEGGKVNVGDKIAFIGGEGEEAPKEQEKEKAKEEKEEKPKAKEEKRRKRRRRKKRRLRRQKKRLNLKGQRDSRENRGSAGESVAGCAPDCGRARR